MPKELRLWGEMGCVRREWRRKGRGERSLGEKTGVQRPNQEAGGQGVKPKLRNLGGLPAAPQPGPASQGLQGSRLQRPGHWVRGHQEQEEDRGLG